MFQVVFKAVLRCVLGLVAFFTFAELQAEILQYRDSRGRIHLTDRPIAAPGFVLIKRYSYASKTARFNPNGTLAERRKRYAALLNKIAQKTRLDVRLLHAVTQIESSYDPNAVSKSGAVGLMQLMPDTARRYGVSNRRDPEQNVSAGARYLKYLLKLFDQDLKLALAGYNAGENAVIRAGKRIPPFPETQRYVQKVLAVLKADQPHLAVK